MQTHSRLASVSLAQPPFERRSELRAKRTRCITYLERGR